MIRKRLYSGICMCGHRADRHHLSMIFDEEVKKIEGLYRAGCCLFFGCNEEEGDDEHGNIHCYRFVDAEDPDEEVRAKWKGTKR